jgi:hypothetical protein
MDRYSLEGLGCTIMRHAKKDGRVRLSDLLNVYGATDLAANVGLADCLDSGFVPGGVMCLYLSCLFRIAGRALAMHGLVTEHREGEDTVFELTTRGAEVARRGSRALRIDWHSHGWRRAEAPTTATASDGSEPRDDDHD